MHAPLGDGLQPQEIPQVYPKTRKERGGKPCFVFFTKNSAPECSMAFFKSTKSGSYSSLTKKARPLKTAYIGSGLKKLRGCATVTVVSHSTFYFPFEVSCSLKSNASSIQCSKSFSCFKFSSWTCM